MLHWHQQTCAEAIERLGADVTTGRTSDQAKSLLAEQGPNELIDTGGRALWAILWDQFSGAMVIMLIVAAGVSTFLQEYTDAFVILAIILLNATLGFVQEYQAERAMAALKKLVVSVVRVRRDGRIDEILARDLVPGDIVMLEAGKYIPADCRLFETVDLKIQEASLTGESESVEKQCDPLLGDELPLGDRTNMAYLGTIVTYGRGCGVVTETGMNTELGHIARSLDSVERASTPLQKRLAQLGRVLALVAIGIVTIVFLVGILSGIELRLMLMTSLSLAVAVVPEGLPAVATVALTIGARRISKRKALIRKLNAVETLGSVTVICSDKTGTLTENRMTVTMLDVAGDRLELTNAIHRGQPTADHEVSAEIETLRDKIADNSSLALLLAGVSLCNNVELSFDDVRHQFVAIGEPTEGALALTAARLGLCKEPLLMIFPRETEVPFDSDRKRMTTVHRIQTSDTDARDRSVKAMLRPILGQDGDRIAFTKGAVDSILSVCQFVWDAGEQKPIDDHWRRRIAEANDDLAGSGMRVLGVAFRPLKIGHDLNKSGDIATDDQTDNLTSYTADDVEQDLIFVGMLGMSDLVRPEAAEAMSRCRTAGIRPVMITGDHPLTARYIAKQLNISDDDQILTGRDLDRMSASDLQIAAETTSIYARVSPMHKLQLVQALQARGHVVAMTGDGVNDAPALKQAHIGVAMGITGTDVSKEASQMVLLDDNFSTIVGAVEEGRVAYDNIRKFVKYTLTSNAGEIWVMVLGPLVGMPMPLLPLQILWINLVTDGLPGLALAAEQSEYNIMKRSPYSPKENIFGRGMGRDIAWIGLLMGIVPLTMGYRYWTFDSVDEAHWRTIVFTILTLAQMGNALASRSAHDSLFRIGIFSNKALIGSVALTFLLQIAVIYWPPLQDIFKTSALTAGQLLLCIAVSTIVFWAVEAQKLLLRLRRKGSSQGSR